MAVEEIAKACAAGALILMVQELGSLPIALFGTDEQKQRWLPALATGEQSPAFALSEPEAGSDAGATRTTAVRRRRRVGHQRHEELDHQRGRRRPLRRLRRSPTARRAASPPSSSRRTRPASRSPKFEHKLGIHGSPTGQPVFEDVRVPDANVLGEVGPGMRVALDDARAHAARRRRAGRRIAQGATDYADDVRQGAHRPSASRSSITRRSSSSSPTWRRAPPPPASCSTRPARWPTATTRSSASTPRWPSCSPPTRPCGSRSRPSRCSAATATSPSTRSSA